MTDRVLFLGIDVEVEQPWCKANIVNSGHVDVEEGAVGFYHLEMLLVLIHAHCQEIGLAPDKDLVPV